MTHTLHESVSIDFVLLIYLVLKSPGIRGINPISHIINPCSHKLSHAIFILIWDSLSHKREAFTLLLEW